MSKRVKTTYDRGYVNAMDKIRVFIESNAREDELQMKTNELRIEADKAEKAWKTEVAKVVAGIASTALGAFLMIHHDRFWAICSAGGVQVFDDRYRDGKMIYKDYGKKSV